MNQAQLVFKAIDFLAYLFINPKHIKGITCVQDIAYGCEPNQKYNIYYSGGETAGKPIIVNIHGGGFVEGDKNCRRYMCELLAEHGWFVINANYRKCPAVQITDQFADIWTVLDSIKKLAKQYDVNNQIIVITGDSAGACLAAYMVAALNNNRLREAFSLPKIRIKISGAILYCGVYNFAELIESGKNKFGQKFIKIMAETLTGMKLDTIEDIKNYPYYNYMCLTKYITKHWCPTMLCYAKKDIFLAGQGELLETALRNLKIQLHTHHTDRLIENHCYHFAFASKASKEALEMTYDFLDKIYKPKIAFAMIK